MKIKITSLVVLALATTARGSDAVCGAPTLPKALTEAPLRAPESERVAVKVFAEGTQNYVCGAGKDGKLDWQFTGPRASLYGPGGELIGRHYKDKDGPAWEFEGGAKIVAAKVAERAAPATALSAVNIPFLLLRKASISGKGAFANVTSIQRGDTRGGVPSKTYDVCDSAAVGRVLEVEYQANYYFYVMADDASRPRGLACQPPAAASEIASVPAGDGRVHAN